MESLNNIILQFEAHLKEEEKSLATTTKYSRDIRTFAEFLGQEKLTKEQTIAYKEYLRGRYSLTSANSMLAALNSFLRFIGQQRCCVKLFRVQRRIFTTDETELSRQEYLRLVQSAGSNRLSLVIQTICGTGIRVSELQYITVKAVHAGKAVVNCKNKERIIFIPIPLQKLLKNYIKKAGIQTGSVFISKNGKPLDRSNIWRDMKALCVKAGVAPCKVFPHNLRHLFARTFYAIEKDIVKLADLLGHSNIDTTRIYTMETGDQHFSRLEKMHLILTT